MDISSIYTKKLNKKELDEAIEYGIKNNSPATLTIISAVQELDIDNVHKIINSDIVSRAENISGRSIILSELIKNQKLDNEIINKLINSRLKRRLYTYYDIPEDLLDNILNNIYNKPSGIGMTGNSIDKNIIFRYQKLTPKLIKKYGDDSTNSNLIRNFRLISDFEKKQKLQIYEDEGIFEYFDDDYCIVKIPLTLRYFASIRNILNKGGDIKIKLFNKGPILLEEIDNTPFFIKDENYKYIMLKIYYKDFITDFTAKEAEFFGLCTKFNRFTNNYEF